MSRSVIRGPIWGVRRASGVPPGAGCCRDAPLQAHLSEPHGALLGPHVAAPRHGLRQLCNVVLPVRLGLTLGQPCTPVGDSGAQRDSAGAPRPRAPTRSPAHVASSSLMSCRRLMLGNFSCSSFFIPRLAPTGTTLMLLRGAQGRVA